MGNGDYRGVSNEPPAGYWADTIADEEREAGRARPGRCAICDDTANRGATICDICAAELRRFVREECAGRASAAEIMAEYDLSDVETEAAMREARLVRLVTSTDHCDMCGAELTRPDGCDVCGE